MITTRFIGRLGNSMFQIAAIIGYAKKYGYQWGVPSDQRESSILTHFPNLPRCNERFPDQPRMAYDSRWFNYWDVPNYGDNITLAGYFQSLKFFQNAQDEVKEVFDLEIKPKDACSIHVRRGDYVQHAQSFPPIGMEYLNKAMEVVKASNYLVFSDDLEWCKENLKGNFWFFEGNEKDSLAAMASCSNHIIANSTFSWWGAWLGHNPDKIIVTPSRKNWFGPSNPNYNPTDIIPDNWIQIEW